MLVLVPALVGILLLYDYPLSVASRLRAEVELAQQVIYLLITLAGCLSDFSLYLFEAKLIAQDVGPIVSVRLIIVVNDAVFLLDLVNIVLNVWVNCMAFVLWVELVVHRWI